MAMEVCRGLVRASGQCSQVPSPTVAAVTVRPISSQAAPAISGVSDSFGPWLLVQRKIRRNAKFAGQKDQTPNYPTGENWFAALNEDSAQGNDISTEILVEKNPELIKDDPLPKVSDSKKERKRGKNAAVEKEGSSPLSSGPAGPSSNPTPPNAPLPSKQPSNSKAMLPKEKHVIPTVSSNYAPPNFQYRLRAASSSVMSPPNSSVVPAPNRILEGEHSSDPPDGTHMETDDQNNSKAIVSLPSVQPLVSSDMLIDKPAQSGASPPHISQ